MTLQSKRLIYLLLAAFALVPFLHLSYLYRPFTDIKWMALYGLSAAILLAGLTVGSSREKTVSLPTLGLAFWLGFVLIIINQALVSRFNTAPVPNDYFIDRVSFLVFFIAAFNLQSAQPDFLKKLGRAAILSATLFAFGLFFRLLTSDEATMRTLVDSSSALADSMRALAGSMGDINMAAQLMVFTLPFLLFEWLEARSTRARALLAGLALFLGAAIFVTGCRSVWLGTSLITAYFFLFLKPPFSKKALIPILVGLMGLSAASLAIFPQVRAHVHQKAFMSSMDGREGIWRGTLHMIHEHPFGVGTDQFELAGVAYQDPGTGLVEHHFWASPHDEALRILAEEGWIGLCLFVLCAFILLRFLFRQTRDDRQGGSKKRALLVSLILVATPEIVFQFPLQMANTFLLLALTLGALAASVPAPATETRDSREKPKVSRVFQLFALVFVLVMGSVHCVSIFLGSKYRDDLDKVHLACAIYPTNWHACLQEINLDAKAGYFERAHSLSDWYVSKYPYYYPTLKAASVLASFEGNQAASCGYLKRYDEIFDGQSSLHGIWEKFCKGARSG